MTPFPRITAIEGSLVLLAPATQARQGLTLLSYIDPISLAGATAGIESGASR